MEVAHILTNCILCNVNIVRMKFVKGFPRTVKVILGCRNKEIMKVIVGWWEYDLSEARTNRSFARPSCRFWLDQRI